MSKIPETERDRVPPTLREPPSSKPRRRWPLLLVGVLLAVAVGGGIAVLVVPRPRDIFEPQPSATVPPPKPSLTIAPEHAPEPPPP